MFLRNFLLPLLALGAVVVALPGGGGGETPPPYKQTPAKPEETKRSSAKGEEKQTVCSTQLVSKVKTGESKTTEKVTTTVYIPVTSVANKPYTTVKPVAYTSTGKSKKVDTIYETYVETKVVPITTVIYSTKADTQVKTKTIKKDVPYTVVGTSYQTETGNKQETFVTSSASASVQDVEKTVPYTSPYVETSTQCATKGGYGR